MNVEDRSPAEWKQQLPTENNIHRIKEVSLVITLQLSRDISVV